MKPAFFKRGIWAVFEQALSALASFVPNLLLGRWLSPTEFGAYSCALTGMILIEFAQGALIGEPLMVFGRREFRRHADSYLGAVFGLQTRSSLWASLGFVTAALLSFLLERTPLLSPTFLALAAACPLIQFRLMMRIVCFYQSKQSLGCIGGFLYIGSILTGLAVLSALGKVSSVGAIGVVGISGLFTGFCMAKLLGFPFQSVMTTKLRAIVEHRHGRYARWSATARLLGWVRTSAPFWLLPTFWSYAEGGTFRALVTLIMPMLSLNPAFGPLLLPVLMKREEEHPDGFSRFVLKLYFLVSLPSYLFTAVLWIAGPWVLANLYRNNFQVDDWQIRLFSVIPLILAPTMLFDTIFQARERPKVIFFASLCGTAVTYTGGLTMIAHWGVPGAIGSWILSTGVNLGVLLYHYASSRTQTPSKREALT